MSGSESRLGLTIDPTLVRLQPDVDEGYSWAYVPEKSHLFAKPLSKLSVGAYMELYREVGTSFEAVGQISRSTTSFSATIENMRQEQMKMQEASIQWQELAQKEKELREGLEAKTQETQLAFSVALGEIDRLTDKQNRLRDQLNCLHTKLGSSRQGTEKAYRALRELRRIVHGNNDDDSDDDEGEYLT